MSDVFINPSVVAKEALRQLQNNCVMGNLVYRGYEEEFTTLSRGWKVGSSVTIKAPVYFRTHASRDISAAKVDLLERSTTFSVDTWCGVAFDLTAEEMTFNIDRFTKRFIKPAMQAIANKIDSTLLTLYKDVPAQVGTPGTTPEDLLTYLQAHGRLSDMAVPLEDRHCVINPTAKIYLANTLKGLFHQEMVGTAVQRAMIPPIAGFQMYESQNVQSHTPGTWAGQTIAVDDASIAEGDTTITVDNGSGDWTTTVADGDIFTIATVNACNPISGADLGYARQFVATTAKTDAGTETELACTPGTAPYNIYSEAATSQYLPYQNVYGLHAQDDAVTVVGTASTAHPVNLSFHSNAFGLCMVPIELPASITWKAVESHEGYTISVVRYFNGDTLTETVRFDALFGVKTLNPFMACRIAG